MEAKVMQVVKGGLLVNVGFVVLFLPAMFLGGALKMILTSILVRLWN